MKIQIIVFCFFSLFSLQGEAVFSQNQRLEFVLPDIKGKDVNLDQFSGKKAIVVFWSIFNPASIDELDNLSRISIDSSIVLIGINIDKDTSADEICLFIDSKVWTFIILHDSKQNIFNEIFPKSIVPLTLICNNMHDIIESKQGFIPGDDEWILARVKEM